MPTWFLTGGGKLDHVNHMLPARSVSTVKLPFLPFHILFIRIESLTPVHTQGAGGEVVSTSWRKNVKEFVDTC